MPWNCFPWFLLYDGHSHKQRGIAIEEMEATTLRTEGIIYKHIYTGVFDILCNTLHCIPACHSTHLLNEDLKHEVKRLGTQYSDIQI